jgi:PAS domain S-box-containing protein
MNKIKFNIKQVFFFFLIVIFIDINGQYENIEFEHYTTNEGLSDGFINTILQDSKGFIWICTGYGLNRFDGLSYKVYLTDPKDTTTLSSNFVNNLIEDTIKNLWVATNNSLNLYDKKRDAFLKIRFKVNGIIYDNVSITCCLIDSKGYFWAGGFRSIFRFKLFNNPQINTGVIDADRYVLNEKDVTAPNKAIVYSIIEDNEHKIWTASYSNSLFYMDDKLRAFVAVPINLPEAKYFSDKQKKLICDREGDFFITIELNGLVEWNRKTNKFNYYSPNGTNSGPNSNIMYGVIEDRNGFIWTGSRNNGGINIFNKKTCKFVYYITDPTNPYSLSSNSIVSFFEDRTGNMWVGSGAGNGLDKYCPNKKKFRKYFYKPGDMEGINGNNILCFTENKYGDIWIGTDGHGLNKLNRKTGKIKHYVKNPSDPNSISSNAIISLCEDHNGTLWFGTFDGGLGKMEGRKFSAYYPDAANLYSIADRHTWYVFEDSKNNLWIVTLNRGLELFDRKTNRFYHYINKEDDTTSIFNNSSFQIFEDSRQNLYITGYSGACFINLNDYDFSKMPPNLKFRRISHTNNKNAISSQIVRCVTEDMKGNIWFGSTSTGIDKFDPKTGMYTNYSTTDGLPGNSVISILVDNKNILWIATDKGLAKFNPETHDIYNFYPQDGLLNQKFRGWALKTKDGEMYFGGASGFNSFYPDSIYFNKNKPPVVIIGLKLFNRPVKCGETVNDRIILKNSISETSELIFKHNEDFITFEFVALDYTVPEKNKYAYMMEGFDKDWIYCGTKHEANYTNLDPGKYTFKVKACNNDGLWNEEGTSIKISILPPWWKTAWFKIIIVLIILASIGYMLYKTIVKIKQLANQTILDERNQLQTLIDNIPDQVIIKDKKSRFLILNNSVIKHLGGKNAKEFIGKTDYNFFPIEIATKIFNREQEILTSGIPILNEENNEIINGEKKIFSTTKCPIVNVNGETIGLIVFIRDITAQKVAELEIIRQSEELKNFNTALNETNVLLEERQQQIEEQSEELKITNEQLIEHQARIEEQSKELLVQRDQLSLLNTTKDKLFSILAHDLRGPFNALIGYSELLIKNFKNYPVEKIERQLNYILDSSKQTFYMLNNLLEWSRSQRETIKYNPEPIMISQYLSYELDILKQQASRKNIVIEEKIIGAEKIINADPNLISTVIRNLISNAIKYSFKNKTIQITLTFSDNELLFSVKDEGTGIRPELKENLFKISDIGSTAGTQGEKGTGLGLLICVDFVAKHNGKIWVESELNKGSEFKFSLPLA